MRCKISKLIIIFFVLLFHKFFRGTLERSRPSGRSSRSVARTSKIGNNETKSIYHKAFKGIALMVRCFWPGTFRNIFPDQHLKKKKPSLFLLHTSLKMRQC